MCIVKPFAFVLALSMLAGAAWAAEVAPGDVLAVFENPFETPVTQESLSRSSETLEAGEHLAYVQALAASLDAKVVRVYKSLSVSGNDITVLLHTDGKTEEELLKELRARPDVKSVSLNYVRRLRQPGHQR